MIRWLDQSEAPRLAPLDKLYAALAAVDVLVIEAQRAGGIVVLVDREARTAARAQLAAQPHEQGGLLVGTAFVDGASAEDKRVALVHVRAAVPGQDYSGSSVALRMESAVWSHAQRAMRAGELVVGWYHSHPGLSAFFSETDRRTQRAFFPHPFSLGWVIDPSSGDEKWFLGADAAELAAACVLDRNLAFATEL